MQHYYLCKVLVPTFRVLFSVCNYRQTQHTPWWPVVFTCRLLYLTRDPVTRKTKTTQLPPWIFLLLVLPSVKSYTKFLILGVCHNSQHLHGEWKTSALTTWQQDQLLLSSSRAYSCFSKAAMYGPKPPKGPRKNWKSSIIDFELAVIPLGALFWLFGKRYYAHI